jgi:hypothetical protein
MMDEKRETRNEKRLLDTPKAHKCIPRCARNTRRPNGKRKTKDDKRETGKGWN